MARHTTTVFGGSGFVGRRIVRRLAEQRGTVRIAVRRPEKAEPLRQLAAAGRIETVAADVWDEGTLGPAIDGADAVVNCVGHYVEKSGASFEAVHGRGAENVAHHAAQAGVRGLVHISGIGADANSPSAYVHARGIGEALVREAFPDAAILRPSVIFGPEDSFFNTFARMARFLPALPLFGTGATRLQPVFVDDVAAACASALSEAAAKGRVFELGGPCVYTYRNLLQMVVERTGRRRLLVPVPFAAWELLAALASILPTPPVTRDQVILMKSDNVAGNDMPGLSDLGIAPTRVEDVLPRYIGP